MNQSLQKITENSIMPFVAPKQQDMVAMIGEMQLKKEMSFAIQRVNENSYLAQATPQSVAKAIWNLTITGLTLNPIHNLAYLTPRRVGDNVEAILMPSYRGLVKLLTDTGSVKNVYAHIVYEGDEYEVSLGSNYEIIHKPKRRSKKPIVLYAIGVLMDGSIQHEEMSVEEINEIRDRSDGWKSFKAGKAKSAIWETDWGEMARKTVIKRLSKYLPKTEKWDKVNQAIEIDNEEYPMSYGQESYISTLLEGSAYDERQRGFIQQKLNAGVSKMEAEKIIEDLKLNQLNPLTHGGSHASKTDINNQVTAQIG